VRALFPSPSTTFPLSPRERVRVRALFPSPSTTSPLSPRERVRVRAKLKGSA